MDIVVATLGRLLDLIGQGYISLDHLEYFVLDEADTMLDMGFIHDIRKVIKLFPHGASPCSSRPRCRRTSRSWPTPSCWTRYREVERRSSAAETVEQKVYFVRQAEKKHLLVDVLTAPT